MTAVSAPIKFQRMRASGAVGPGPEPEPEVPIFGVVAISSSIVEGTSTDFEITRNGGSVDAEAIVHWAASTPATASDLISPIAGDVSFASGELLKRITVNTALRSGDQGDRLLTVVLSAVSNAKIDPVRSFANVTILDYVAPPVTDLPKLQPPLPLNKELYVSNSPPAGCKASFPATYAGLANAFASPLWTPGTRIVIDNGTYTGADITLTRDGIASVDGSTSLMVKARNHLKASLNFCFIQEGEYVWFTGIKFPKSRPYRTDKWSWDGTDIGTFSLRKPGLWVTNSKFTSWCVLSLPCHIIGSAAVSKIKDVKICYNDMPANIPAEGYSVGLMYITKLDKKNNIPDNSDIAFNMITALTNPGRGDDAGSRYILQIQPSKPEPSTPPNAARRGFHVHHNWVRGYFHYITYTKRQTQISYNVFRFLGTYYTDCGSIQRHGNIDGTRQYNVGALMEGNLYIHEGNKNVYIQLNGYGSVVSGNKGVTTAKAEIQCAMGTWPKPGKTGEHDAASFAKLVENPGFVVKVGDTAHNDDSFAPDRGGYSDNIRIAKGDSNWNPAVTYGVPCIGGEVCDADDWVKVNGYDGTAKVTTIDETWLQDRVGCDPE